MRYFETLSGTIYSSYSGSGNAYLTWFFKTRKRIAPSIAATYYSGSSLSSATADRALIIRGSEHSGITDATASADL